MAFIKNTEREGLIKKINKSYGFRKFLITIEIFLLVGFIVMTFLSLYFTRKAGTEETVWSWFDTDDTGKITGLTGMGIGMLVWAIVAAILALVSLILTWTLKSPKDTKAKMNKLESSALSGKRVKKSEIATEVTRSRSTLKEKK